MRLLFVLFSCIMIWWKQPLISRQRKYNTWTRQGFVVTVHGWIQHFSSWKFWLISIWLKTLPNSIAEIAGLIQLWNQHKATAAYRHLSYKTNSLDSANLYRYISRRIQPPHSRVSRVQWSLMHYIRISFVSTIKYGVHSNLHCIPVLLSMYIARLTLIETTSSFMIQWSSVSCL